MCAALQTSQLGKLGSERKFDHMDYSTVSCLSKVEEYICSVGLIWQS